MQTLGISEEKSQPSILPNQTNVTFQLELGPPTRHLNSWRVLPYNDEMSFLNRSVDFWLRLVPILIGQYLTIQGEETHSTKMAVFGSLPPAPRNQYLSNGRSRQR